MRFIHGTKLVTLWNPDPRVLEKLNGSGFENLHKLQASMGKIDLNLARALVEFYDVCENCFVFNGIRLILSLKDVWFITGLPVNGNAVSGSEGKAGQLCCDLLGSDLSSNHQDRFCRHVKLDWLREKYEKLDLNASEVEIEQYTRAYVLHLIGSFIVPQKDQLVPAMYLSLLENIEKIGDFAWGAALLANLLCSIDDFRGGRVIHVQGNIYVLIIFAMEHIAMLVVGNLKLKNVNPLPLSFPLLVGWSENLDQALKKNTRLSKSIAFYREIFDQLEHGDVNWEPYTRLVEQGLFPKSVFAYQERVFLCRVVVLCYDKAVYHRPDLAPEQFSLRARHLKKNLPSVAVINREKPRLTITDWRSVNEYEHYFEMWQNRRNFTVVDSEDLPMDCSIGVMEGPSNMKASKPNQNATKISTEHRRPSNSGGNRGLKRSKSSMKATEKDSPKPKLKSAKLGKDRALALTILVEKYSIGYDDDDEDDCRPISHVFKLECAGKSKSSNVTEELNPKSSQLDSLTGRSFEVYKELVKAKNVLELRRSQAAIVPRVCSTMEKATMTLNTTSHVESADSEQNKAPCVDVGLTKNGGAIERFEIDPISRSKRIIVCPDEDDQEHEGLKIESRVSRLERLIGELKRKKCTMSWFNTRE